MSATRSWRASTTPSSTRSDRRPTAGSGFRARTFRARGRPPSSLPGTTATRTSSTWSSTSRTSARSSIGNGNVALDVARMLALTREELAATDTTDAAIEAIVASGIREILVLGRRGPVQAAWTSTELHELGEMKGADVLVDPDGARARSGERRPSSRPRRTSSSETSRSCASSRRTSARRSRGSCDCASGRRRSRFSGTSAWRRSSSSGTGSSRTVAGAFGPSRRTRPR